MHKASNYRAILRALSAFAAIACMSSWSAPAEAGAVVPYRVLHEFCKGTCIDGSFPAGEHLVLDVSGKLYGTTFNGGRHNAGVIYDVFPKHGGARYFKKVLKPFCYGACNVGQTQAGVIMDTSGNLYGTTASSGSSCGVAYEAVLNGGKYTLKVLHIFGSSGDGCSPTPSALAYNGKESGQLYDGTSPLFGVTLEGGANGRGAVFELIPPAPGRKSWQEKVIYSHCEITGCADGHDPLGNVIEDSAGNLYTASQEAAGGQVFQLTPDGSGGFVKSPVYQSVTHEIFAFLRMTSDGTLYGVTESGGPHGHGTLFTLTPDGGGGYGYSDLHDFCASGTCTDGDEPEAATMDSSGNIWGVTLAGGANPAPQGSPFSGAGVIFEYTAGGSFAVVRNFCAEPNCTDGGAPTSELTTDGAGNFFGVTALGGVPLTPGHAPATANSLWLRAKGSKTPLPPPAGGGGVLYEISVP